MWFVLDRRWKGLQMTLIKLGERPTNPTLVVTLKRSEYRFRIQLFASDH